MMKHHSEHETSMHHGKRGGRKHRDGQEAPIQGGAKTFRRGRVLMFLEQLESNRATLKRQLETEELQTIHPIIVGELKATDSIIDEFKRVFEIFEHETTIIDVKKDQLESK